MSNKEAPPDIPGNNPVSREIGSRVGVLMRHKGLTQAVLADALGCAVSGVSRRLSGEYRWDVEEVKAAADVLDEPVSSIIPS